MKRISLVLVAVLFLLALVAVPHTTFAAADATCSADPSSGPVGTTFVITCGGYTPNSHVYAYLVEPSGAVGTLYATTGAIKVDQDGFISYSQQTQFGTAYTLGAGTWTFVAEELGLAKAVLHRGQVSFTITGGTEGVSGAELWSEPSTINKPVVAYDHLNLGFGSINVLAYSDPATIYGSGFQPGEMVSYWLEPAGGSCSSMTQHDNATGGQIEPGVAAIYVHQEWSTPIFDGNGSQAFATVKADSSGNASVSVYFTSIACEGVWKFVARGNSSWNGAEASLTVVGNSVATNAWLAADPGTVTALFDTVHFSGNGFGANEHVSCWLTTPQGQTLGYPNDYFFTYSIPGEYTRTEQIKSDAGGNIGFSLTTGSEYDRTSVTLSAGGDTQSGSLDTYDPVASEGALGEYAMTCRGDSSGAAAIARFTVTGGFVDP